MGSGSDWRVEHVLCGGSSEDLAALGVGALHAASLPPGTGIKAYPALALAQDDKMMGAMQQQASMSGVALFVCAVAVPIGPGQLSHDQLIRIFERLVLAAAAKRGDMDGGDGYSPSKVCP